MKTSKPAAKVSAPKASKQIQTQDLTAINVDLMDQLIFKEMSQTKVGELMEEGTSSEALVQDVFSSLYKLSPKVKDAAPMAQKGLAEQLLKLPEYKQLHGSAKLDEIGSAFGTLQLAPALLEQLEEIEEKLEEEDRKQPKPGEGSGPNGEVQLSDVLSDEEMSDLRNGLRNGIKKAQGDVDKWENAKGGWGMDPAELKSVPFQQRMELAEKLLKTPKLAAVADLVGRFKNVVNAAKAIIPRHGNDELVDVGPGRNLEHMLPTEMIKLKRNRKQFYRDMLEGKTLVYNLRGVDNLGRGPLIILTDHSGSMEGPRDEWAKAVTISMMHLAEKQKRAFGYVAFNAGVKYRRFFARGMSVTIQDKIEIASMGPDGGTDFYKPLKAAFEMRQKDKDLKPADIVLITDGDYRFSEAQLKEILKLKEETSVRIFGVAINDHSPYGAGTDGEDLEAFCDEVAVVNSLGEIQTIRQMVKQVAADEKSKKLRKGA